MNLKNKGILITALIVIMLLVAGCSQEATPYEINNADDYRVSVKFDANGGIFTTNTSVIVDSYNLSELPQNGGKAQIALLTPDDPLRGNDAFTAINNGYFLAGWYAQRTQTTDEQGNTTYTYASPWDFETGLLEVDPSGTYSAEEPVLTLYAAWVPLFEIQFYALDTGEHLESLSFNPMEVEAFTLPAWDEETGAIEMHKFPERSGYTFEKAFYDKDGTKAVEGQTLTHTGVVDTASGTAENPVMKLYLQWTEGEWYHIYNVEQFLDNASVNGSYVIHADLDFEGEIWPSSLMYGNFAGTIQGNGHTFKNISLEQTNNSKINAGLFGHLTEHAAITDLTLENVSFTIKAGTRVAGTCYGLFAGAISGEATLNGVTIRDSRLLIDSGCYFGVDDYSIGLLCGMGSADIDVSEIVCAAAGENPDSVVITVEGSDVTVEFTAQ